MTAGKRIVLVFIFVVVSSASLTAQALERRHQAGIRAGWWNQVTDSRTELNEDGVSVAVGQDGAWGGVFYEHWLQENLALDFSIGGMVPDISVSAGIPGVTSETATVGHVLVGVKYYFPQSTYARSVRPFARASVGPVIGDQNTVEVGFTVSMEDRSEVALGGVLAGGVDFVLGEHFMLSAETGYNLMTDFGEPIGGSKNYSGPQFSIGFGYLFGGGNI